MADLLAQIVLWWSSCCVIGLALWVAWVEIGRLIRGEVR